MKTLVVVPTLGQRPELLRKALASIQAQNVAELDLVAVAPLGRGVEQMVGEFGGRFVPDPGRGGLSGALNAGLAAADPDTSYFAWLGDDDLLANGSLTSTLAA